ncbi:MAG: hypothetical protein M1814_004341 [Vezdaea aestivalis]|nr:MAG: hypothetical protein M1814_004341 [Vezdaea aestivalis]
MAFNEGSVTLSSHHLAAPLRQALPNPPVPAYCALPIALQNIDKCIYVALYPVEDKYRLGDMLRVVKGQAHGLFFPDRHWWDTLVLKYEITGIGEISRVDKIISKSPSQVYLVQLVNIRRNIIQNSSPAYIDRVCRDLSHTYPNFITNTNYHLNLDDLQSLRDDLHGRVVLMVHKTISKGKIILWAVSLLTLSISACVGIGVYAGRTDLCVAIITAVITLWTLIVMLVTWFTADC